MIQGMIFMGVFCSVNSFLIVVRWKSACDLRSALNFMLSGLSTWIHSCKVILTTVSIVWACYNLSPYEWACRLTFHSNSVVCVLTCTCAGVSPGDVPRNGISGAKGFLSVVLDTTKGLYQIYIPFLKMFIYFQREKRERGTRRDKENPKQALRCQHRAWCGARSHEPWDHDLSRSGMLSRLSHPGAPPPIYISTSSGWTFLFPQVLTITSYSQTISSLPICEGRNGTSFLLVVSQTMSGVTHLLL